mgnify:CR=1 FL=1|jgi:formiminotetrahydrofolate cyclodeaminase
MPNLSTSPRALAQLQVDEFLRKLAGSDPTPGGGSAAALGGAIAASLVTMVAGLTVGKPGFEEVSESLELLAEQGHQIAETLVGAIDRDAAAYDGVTAAFKLPKGTDEEKSERSAAIQHAMKAAAEVPLEVATECLAAAELALVALEKGNPNACTDAGSGLLFALAGLESAVLNVAVNLDSIKDAGYVAEQKAEIAELLARAAELRSTVWSNLRPRLASLPS